MIAVTASTIADFTAAEWDRLFPGELEGWAYHRASERAALVGLEWLYVGVRDGGQLRAAAVAFITDYPLATTLDGSLRRMVGTLARAAPGLLRPRMLALGSPVTETCPLGFAADADGEEQAACLAAILAACERQAQNRRVQLLAIKDLPDDRAASLQTVLTACGLRQQPGQPGARLALPFRDLDGYFASLGRATRRDLRRKWRSREHLRIQWRSDLAGIDERVAQLYRQTLARAPMRLEELNPAWFANVLAALPGRAACVCYWHGADLVAFNLVLHDGRRLLDKYIGMDYARARELNLYYVSWLENIRHAIEHGLHSYDGGQGLGTEKLRLGCVMQGNGLWYRHRNRLLDRGMALAERALGLHDAPAVQERCA